jgi:hypothetical protein
LFTLKLISEIIYLIRQGLDELFEIANHLSANGYVDTRKAFLVGCNQAIKRQQFTGKNTI